MEQLLDVIVVGAGVAGLSCARTLAQQGLRVVVLEARDRVGGRILTLHESGEPPLELGAQVIHGDKAATWQVVHEADIDAPPQPAPGEC